MLFNMFYNVYRQMYKNLLGIMFWILQLNL